MSKIEQLIYSGVMTMIADNLELLINNRSSCLCRINKYCSDMYDIAENSKIILNQKLLTTFTEEVLYALLNANFLYDFRDIE